MAANQRITHFEDSAQTAYEAAGNRLTEACQSTEDLLRHNPTTSLMVTFGVGVGLGVALAELLTPPPRRRTWAERNLPDWMSREHVGELLAHLPEKVTPKRMSSWW